MNEHFLMKIPLYLFVLFSYGIIIAQSPITVNSSTSVNDNTHCNDVQQGVYNYFIKVNRSIKPRMVTATPITFTDDLVSYKFYRLNMNGHYVPVLFSHLFRGEYMLKLTFNPQMINSLTSEKSIIDIGIVYQIKNSKYKYTDIATFKDCALLTDDPHSDIENPDFTSDSNNNAIVQLDKSDLKIINNISNLSSSLIIYNKSVEPLSLYLISVQSGNYIPILQNENIELGRRNISLDQFFLESGRYQVILTQKGELIQKPLIIIN